MRRILQNNQGTQLREAGSKLLLKMKLMISRFAEVTKGCILTSFQECLSVFLGCGGMLVQSEFSFEHCLATEERGSIR